ncbi:HDOD domain-containing protein [Aquisalimonas lutea]|uniref:HDOD domain-containing protein n=1 Tax=Aquisalimonas lutea TaxID=1327750 RepID=UPI0025B460D4|nr:HDOD domain-containing protein [Aquisalimonas lutea]MDN3516055.1 HDOD domain-containing protein [Aquisalimonas lutea]
MTPDTMVARLDNLVSFPDAYYRVEHLIADPYATFSEIGAALSGDPAMASRVLGVVNSAFYGFPSRIDSIPMAITIIGTRGLRDLMLGMAVARQFRNIGTDLVDMERFWEHSIYCGLMARALGREAGAQEAERLFLAGLFHDLGKLVIYQVVPAEAEAILRELAGGDRPLQELERRRLGCDHAEVGHELLRRWQMPAMLQEAVAWHHAPDRAAEHPQATALVHVADALAQRVESGYRFTPGEDGEAVHPAARSLAPKDEATRERLRLTVDLETVELYELLFAEP